MVIVKFVVLTACFFAYSNGLLDCTQRDAKLVNLIYNESTVVACKDGREQLAGCILNFVLDPESHVFFVPIKYMIETYRQIWKIYNHTADRDMFVRPERMYQDCSDMLELITMSGFTYREFDLVLEHFKSAYKGFMPDGQIPQNVEPEPENKAGNAPHTLTVDSYGYDDKPVRRPQLKPIYNISLCNIQVVYGDTFIVHSNMSMHYCHPVHKNLTFVTCSDTSRPAETLKCIDVSNEEMDELENVLDDHNHCVNISDSVEHQKCMNTRKDYQTTKSALNNILDNKNSRIAAFIKLAEFWDPRRSCKEMLAKLRPYGWSPKFTNCFAWNFDTYYETEEIPLNVAYGDLKSSTGRSTDS